jgi:PleD family two-component response regulator
LGLAYLIPDPAFTLDVFINNADQALYLAKQQGRNCVVAWTPVDHRVDA